MGKQLEWTFLQRRYTNSQQPHEEMHIISQQGMQIKTTCCTISYSLDGFNKKKKKISVGKDVEKLEQVHCWWE